MSFQTCKRGLRRYLANYAFHPPYKVQEQRKRCSLKRARKKCLNQEKYQLWIKRTSGYKSKRLNREIHTFIVKQFSWGGSRCPNAFTMRSYTRVWKCHHHLSRNKYGTINKRFLSLFFLMRFREIDSAASGCAYFLGAKIMLYIYQLNENVIGSNLPFFANMRFGCPLFK